MKNNFFQKIFVICILLLGGVCHAFSLEPSEGLTDIKDPFAPKIPQPTTPEIPPPVESSNNGDTTVTMPTSQVSQQQNPVENFVVSGLVWNSARPQAIVNDTVVSIGDMIGVAKVTNIERDGITLFADGNLYKIRSQTFSNSAETQGK